MPLIVSRAKVVYGRSSLMGSRQVPNCLALAPAKVRSHCRHQVTKPSRRYRLPFPLGLLNVAVPAGGSRSNCTLICHIVTISYCNAPPSPGKSFLPTSLDHDGTWFVPPCLWRYSGHTRSSHSWVPEWAEGITPLGATNSSRLLFYSFINDHSTPSKRISCNPLPSLSASTPRAQPATEFFGSTLLRSSESSFQIQGSSSVTGSFM